MLVIGCPYCQGQRDAAAIHEHNLRCAEYGERVYLGRDDPRLPLPTLPKRVRRDA